MESPQSSIVLVVSDEVFYSIRAAIATFPTDLLQEKENVAKELKALREFLFQFGQQSYTPRDTVRLADSVALFLSTRHPNCRIEIEVKGLDNNIGAKSVFNPTGAA